MNINRWIYSELIKNKQLIEKNIKDYRFDEASRNIYQFVWHSYCDWYLELTKTIFNSGKKGDIKETKEIASFVFKEILVLLHPFIPFITEEIWLKNKLDNNSKDYLMYSNWIGDKAKKQSFDDVEKIKYLRETNSFFYGIDLNSKFEVGPGKKNIKKIKEFLKKLI